MIYAELLGSEQSDPSGSWENDFSNSSLLGEAHSFRNLHFRADLDPDPILCLIALKLATHFPETVTFDLEFSLKKSHKTLLKPDSNKSNCFCKISVDPIVRF